MVMANIAIEMSSYPQCSKEFIFLEWLNLYEFIAMIVSNFDNQLKGSSLQKVSVSEFV